MNFNCLWDYFRVQAWLLSLSAGAVRRSIFKPQDLVPVKVEPLGDLAGDLDGDKVLRQPLAARDVWRRKGKAPFSAGES
jgi:hypothetical protein